MPVFDSAWEDWLDTNIERGCLQHSLIESMVNAGFEPAIASRIVIGRLTPASVTAPSSDYQYDAAPVSRENRIWAHDREINVLARADRPQIVVFGNVLSDTECDEIIARSRKRLTRSTTVNPLTGEHDVIERRTSDGTCFSLCEDEFVARIDHRIAALMNWPLENGEGLQILRYGVGGEYQPHFDYFPPGDPGSAAHLGHGGQRVATLVIYLSDVERGGATIFPDAGLSVYPRKGGATYFRYFNRSGQVDPLTLHGGAPVEAGEKWIMTKWMRERRYA